MKKLLFHLIVILGAISTAVTMAALDTSKLIIVFTTVIYVLIFEGLFIFMAPRLIMAERKRNSRIYPMLQKLIDNERSSITLHNDETIFNATFLGYSSPKDVKNIDIEIFIPKQAKIAASKKIKQVSLAQIKEVKIMKR